MKRSVLQITALVISGLLLVSLSSSLLAVESAGRPAVSKERLINLDLSDCPLKMVFEYLFKDSGDQYELDPALDGPPYDKITVSLSLRNVTFTDALKSICKAHGLTYRREGSPYTIAPKGQPSDADPDAAAQAPAHDPEPGNREMPSVLPKETADSDKAKLERAVVRLNIPRMPVKDAVWTVMTKGGPPPAWSEPEGAWEFKGKLGSTVMPGARFYNFPREKAARLMLIASGLLPPSPGERIIQNEGKADVKAHVLDAGGYGLQMTSLPGGVWCMIDGGKEDQPGISIGAYLSGEKWLYTIMANVVKCPQLLDAILMTSGVEYSFTPQVTADRRVLSRVRLYNVTLDQALDGLLRTLGMSFYKTGTSARPMYVITGQ